MERERERKRRERERKGGGKTERESFMARQLTSEQTGFSSHRHCCEQFRTLLLSTNARAHHKPLGQLNTNITCLYEGGGGGTTMLLSPPRCRRLL